MSAGPASPARRTRRAAVSHEGEAYDPTPIVGNKPKSTPLRTGMGWSPCTQSLTKIQETVPAGLSLWVVSTGRGPYRSGGFRRRSPFSASHGITRCGERVGAYARLCPAPVRWHGRLRFAGPRGQWLRLGQGTPRHQYAADAGTQPAYLQLSSTTAAVA